jgi:hypothetical protein
MDLACPHRERDILERLHARKPFRDPLYREGGGSRRGGRGSRRPAWAAEFPLCAFVLITS